MSDERILNTPRPEVPYPRDRVQAGLAPATTIRQLVDACRQDTAGVGARLYSIKYLLSEREDDAARAMRIEESLAGLEAHLIRLDGKLTLALEEDCRAR